MELERGVIYILQWNIDKSGTWFEVDETGQVQSEQAITDLSDCPQIDSDVRLIVLLPGQLIRTMQLTLPKMRASERTKAIPFLIEEQLACEPSQIDVAMGATDSTGQCVVAVFDKERFKAKLSKLHEQQLNPDVVLPDYLALPWEENTWTICPLSDVTLVRTGLQIGFIVDTCNLATLLKKSLDNAAENDVAPEKIICYQKNSVIDTSQLDALDVKVVFQEMKGQGVFDFAALCQAPALNMLQGIYRPKHKVSAQKRNWQIAIGVIALWLFVLLGGHIAQWIYYSHKKAQVSVEVFKVYRSIFPDAKTVLEPRFRVNEILNKLKKIEQDDLFLRLLAASGKVLYSYPTALLQNIQFQNKQLKLQVSAKNMITLSHIRSDMRDMGLVVSQEVHKPDDKTVGATFSVQEAS